MPPLCMNEETAPIQLWGGVECTTNRVGDLYVRQLRRNHHWDHLEDLDRIAKLGIRTLRYPLLWEELAPEEGRGVDWSWADRRMERLSELGIRPIVGLLHHGSGPRHTSLVDSSFPEQLAEYARAVAERYPWVDAWTPMNEPLTTARFSGLYGHWYPHGRDVATFCRALMTQLRGVVLAMREIRLVNPKAMLVQIGAQPVAKAILAQPAFEHQQNRRALIVDHAIVHVARSLAAVYGDPDRARARWIVHRHDALARDDRGDMNPLGRFFLVHHLGGDPGGKAFTEPNVVPGCLSHQVAEPLMTDLMSLQRAKSARHGGSFLIWRHQQIACAVRDQSRILHRAEGSGRKS